LEHGACGTLRRVPSKSSSHSGEERNNTLEQSHRPGKRAMEAL